MSVGFIYLWENQHPEANKHKKYIGQHIGNPDDGYTGSGAIFLKKFYCDKYYGHWKRTILESCDSVDELNDAEKKWIEKHNAVHSDEFCNLKFGGRNGKHGPESIEKLKKSLKGRTPWNKGKKMSKQDPVLVKKRMDSLKRSKREQYDLEEKLILKYIENNLIIHRNQIPEILGRGGFQIGRLHISRMLKKNLIKKITISRVTKYTKVDFSFEDVIIEFIRKNKDCTSNDIYQYMEQYGFMRSAITRMCTSLRKNGSIATWRGYRTTHYYIP